MLLGNFATTLNHHSGDRNAFGKGQLVRGGRGHEGGQVQGVDRGLDRVPRGEAARGRGRGREDGAGRGKYNICIHVIVVAWQAKQSQKRNLTFDFNLITSI